MRSRNKKDDMLKRERDRLTRILARYLATLGAQTEETSDRSTGPQAMYIETLAGRLQITCYGDWLACRFDDVDRAKALLPHGPGERLNSHSGKWNFHFGRITAEEALAAFRAELEPILPRTLAGIITVLRVDHHIEFIRVHEQDGLQEPVHDPHDVSGICRMPKRAPVRPCRFPASTVTTSFPFCRTPAEDKAKFRAPEPRGFHEKRS